MSFLPCFGGAKQLPDEEGFYLACQVNDVPANGTTKVKINKKEVAIFKVKDEKTRVYAMNNVCVHEGFPLAGGEIEDVNGDMCIRCPGHGIQYSLKTGISVQENGSYIQKVYKVKKKGQEIWVKF